MNQKEILRQELRIAGRWAQHDDVIDLEINEAAQLQTRERVTRTQADSPSNPSLMKICSCLMSVILFVLACFGFSIRGLARSAISKNNNYNYHTPTYTKTNWNGFESRESYSICPVILTPPEIHENTNHTECLTTKCKYVAKVIQAKLNPRINPCDDFYTFACGGWIRKQNQSLFLNKETPRDNFETITQELLLKFQGITII